MIRFLLTLFLAGATTACAGPVSLFNGSTLDGWQTGGDADWSVQSREIVATGSGQGFLMTDAHYGDFHLRVEFWVESTVNSGVFIRCQDRDLIDPDTCYEFNIWDQHPKQEARTGSIVYRLMPPLAHVDTLGHWNTYEITARGSFLEARVNGEVTARLEDADGTAGFIALQHWQNGTLRFRNIELKPL
jgi:hypothetical protein